MGEDRLISSIAPTEIESEQLGEQRTRKGTQEESSVTNQHNQRAENCYRIFSEPFLGTHYSQHPWPTAVKYPEVTLY